MAFPSAPLTLSEIKVWEQLVEEQACSVAWDEPELEPPCRTSPVLPQPIITTGPDVTNFCGSTEAYRLEHEEDDPFPPPFPSTNLSIEIPSIPGPSSWSLDPEPQPSTSLHLPPPLPRPIAVLGPSVTVNRRLDPPIVAGPSSSRHSNKPYQRPKDSNGSGRGAAKWKMKSEKIYQIVERTDGEMLIEKETGNEVPHLLRTLLEDRFATYTQLPDGRAGRSLAFWWCRRCEYHTDRKPDMDDHAITHALPDTIQSYCCRTYEGLATPCPCDLPDGFTSSHKKSVKRHIVTKTRRQKSRM